MKFLWVTSVMSQTLYYIYNLTKFCKKFVKKFGLMKNYTFNKSDDVYGEVLDFCNIGK